MSKTNALLVLLTVGCSSKRIEERFTSTPIVAEGEVAVRGLQEDGVSGYRDSTSMMSTKDLAGVYVLGAGQAANVMLMLYENGTFTETVSDCMARPISDSGAWCLTEDGVLLQSHGGRDAASPIPERRLTVARGTDTLFLVGNEYLATLLVGGSPMSNCYRMESASAAYTLHSGVGGSSCRQRNGGNVNRGRPDADALQKLWAPWSKAGRSRHASFT
jgi:hypothetical protein